MVWDNRIGAASLERMSWGGQENFTVEVIAKLTLEGQVGFRCERHQ